jgi:hypothetical protein
MNSDSGFAIRAHKITTLSNQAVENLIQSSQSSDPLTETLELDVQRHYTKKK